MSDESTQKWYDAMLDRLADAARVVFAEALAQGEATVLVSQVRSTFGQLSGRPTALVPNVLRYMKGRGEIEDFTLRGKEGIVYLKQPDERQGGK